MPSVKDRITGKYIKDIEGEYESSVKRAQETGEDYPAKLHTMDPKFDSKKAAQEMIDRDKKFLDADIDAEEWDAGSGSFKQKKMTGYSMRYGKPHPAKGY